MGKYPKVVQCDSRGQIVIPKTIRSELKIEEGAAFWMYQTEEGIFLKRIEAPPTEKMIKKSVKEVREK
jgi:AbrB family looped-hinge helix DNA binding protein